MGYTSAQYQREWRLKNKEKVLAYQRDYREKHREHINRLVKEGVRRWRKRNPEKTYEQNRLSKAVRRARLNEARIEGRIRFKDISNWESRICGICESAIENDYHIDHIVPLSKGGSHTVGNLQLAHPYCNQSKFNSLP